MSSVVFILGAGASKQCGAPLMADFLDTADNLYHKGMVNEKTEHFERVFQAIGSLQAVHSKSQLDLTNIESIFTALEIANVLGKLPGFKSEEIPTVIASLKELIVQTLEKTIDFPTRGIYIEAPRPYDSFSGLLHYLETNANPKQSVSIITFNYDIAIDVALDRGGMRPDYGIPPYAPTHSAIPLLKLHGSLNWAVRKDNNSVQPLLLENYFKHYHVRDFDPPKTCTIPIGSQLSEYFEKYADLEVKAEPVIVPPTWNKADYHQTLSTVWASAAHQLEEAEHIFIIGYSLPATDAFFRLLYALGTVGKNPLRRIVVFNPDTTGEVERRFRELLGPGALGRFDYVSHTFEQAIGDIQSYFPGK